MGLTQSTSHGAPPWGPIPWGPTNPLLGHAHRPEWKAGECASHCARVAAKTEGLCLQVTTLPRLALQKHSSAQRSSCPHHSAHNFDAIAT